MQKGGIIYCRQPLLGKQSPLAELGTADGITLHLIYILNVAKGEKGHKVIRRIIELLKQLRMENIQVNKGSLVIS